MQQWVSGCDASKEPVLYEATVSGFGALSVPLNIVVLKGVRVGSDVAHFSTVGPAVFAGMVIVSVPMVPVAAIMEALALPLFGALVDMSTVECGLKGRGWLLTKEVSICEAGGVN